MEQQVQDKSVKKTVRLDNNNYYETHLSLINNVLPEPARMTPTEIRVLARFMALKGDLAVYRFGPTAKKVVMAELNLSAQGLSNHLGNIRDKDLIYDIRDKNVVHDTIYITTISPILFPDEREQVYNIKLINKDNETTTQ